MFGNTKYLIMKKIIVSLFLSLLFLSCKKDYSATYTSLEKDLDNKNYRNVSYYIHSNNFIQDDDVEKDTVYLNIKKRLRKEINDSLYKLYKSTTSDKFQKIDSLKKYLKLTKTKKYYENEEIY